MPSPSSNFPRNRARSWAGALLVGIGGIVTAASAGAADLPAILTPQPEVIAFAHANGIPLSGISPAADSKAAAPGDFVVVLITLRQGNATKQWLTRFEVSPMTEKERGEAGKAGQVLTLTASETRKYEFDLTANVALDILAAGPFVEGEKPPVKGKQARTLISSELLGLGLDEACRMLVSRKAVDASSKSPAPAWSEEEQRTFLGSVPALVAFVQGVQSTPGLAEILWAVMEKPSVWSLIKNRGHIGVGINLGDAVVIEPRTWTLPGRSLFGMDVNLAINAQPAVWLLLVVTAPRPPLVTTAGIVGILARPPGKTDKRMDLQLIAAGRAPPTGH